MVGLVDLFGWVCVLKLADKVCVAQDDLGIFPLSVDGLVGGFPIACVLLWCPLVVWCCVVWFVDLVVLIG